MPGDQELFPIVDVPAGPPDAAAMATLGPRPAPGPQPPALFGLSLAQLTDLVRDLGQPAYRARQLEQALYRQWVSDLDTVTTLPRNLRQALLEAGYQVGLPEITQTFRSVDGTERYLIAGLDGQTVETVWMPGGDGGESDAAELAESEEEAGEAVDQAPMAKPAALNSNVILSEAKDLRFASGGSPIPRERPAQRRATICVSSQIGCAVNCHFCLTARLGILRNLTPGEIAGQVVAVLRRQGVHLGRDRINLVFMGMGEPFLNYDAFLAALHLLTDCVGLAASRMTVSTSGIVPGILRFAQEPVRCKLAISLNASNDLVREQIMPITRKWKIDAILDAVRTIPLGPRERITFEYVLLGGVNDRLDHADEVVRIVRTAGFPCYVNLIVWNPGPGTSYAQPDQPTVDAFQRRLISQGVTAYIRRPRGRDIYAACGQLKRTTS
ncbi:MAG TPA: 23S rRNA (adenine(2503)-C(2))-methyltransferase RlmN [Acidobacteriaceae bacterium]